jgi:hypothetical protein
MIDNWFNQFEYLGITFYPTTAKGQTIKVYVEINNPLFTVDSVSTYIKTCLDGGFNFDIDFSEYLSTIHTSKVRRVTIPSDVLKTTLISFSYE